MPDKSIFVNYTSANGQTNLRRIRPLSFFFGYSDYHGKGAHPSWYMECEDLDRTDQFDKPVFRTFDLSHCDFMSPKAIK